MPWLAFGVEDGPTKTFQRLKSFFWLVGRRYNASIRFRGEKTFQPVNLFFPYFFGPVAFGGGLGSIALACHGFASAGAVTLRMVPKGILSVTAPALAKPWHASAMLPNPPPNATGPKKYGKNKFTG